MSYEQDAALIAERELQAQHERDTLRGLREVFNFYKNIPPHMANHKALIDYCAPSPVSLELVRFGIESGSLGSQLNAVTLDPTTMSRKELRDTVRTSTNPALVGSAIANENISRQPSGFTSDGRNYPNIPVEITASIIKRMTGQELMKLNRNYSRNQVNARLAGRL